MVGLPRVEASCDGYLSLATTCRVDKQTPSHWGLTRHRDARFAWQHFIAARVALRTGRNDAGHFLILTSDSVRNNSIVKY